LKSPGGHFPAETFCLSISQFPRFEFSRRRHNDRHQEYWKREAVSLLNKPLICVNTKCNGTNPGRLRLSRRHIRTASDREHAVAGNLGWRIVLDTTIINIVVSNQLATISGPYLHVS
jgi:hypothetical protein